MGRSVNTIKIGDKIIGGENPVLIIAEAGVNYNNNLSLAYKMVDVAVKVKSDVIKFQTFLADEIQLKNSKKPEYQNKLKNQTYYEIIKNLESSFEDQIKIYEYCKKRKILFLSTPYDKKSADFLDQLGVEAFKISSSDLANHILLKHIISKKKPIFLSTGLSDMTMVKQTMKLFERNKMKNKLVLFQATSDYPTPEEDVNLKVVTEYLKKFNVQIGFSDHTQSGLATYGAIALGAKVVEKHFTLNRKFRGPDHSSSLEPKELKNWINNIRLMEKSLGSNKKEITKSEKKNLSMRKVLAIKSLKMGCIITNEHIFAIRGNEKGVLPLENNLKKIIGKKVNLSINKPKQLSWKMVK